MKIDGKPHRTIWPDADGGCFYIIDQRRLPHGFEIIGVEDWRDGVAAIRDMAVRGAPLIGATTAWSLYLAAHQSPTCEALATAAKELIAARPTAINLRWAVSRVMKVADGLSGRELIDRVHDEAVDICEQDVGINQAIGAHGVGLIEEIAAARQGSVVNILTHCNAGWLATVDWGTATAPIYRAHDQGIAVHVWVDETRPRNQGAQLTAWELGQHGVPHTVIVDNAGGHLMQNGEVDLCITGTDRTTRRGDVVNKIGTYLKALAAHDNGIPFFVAAPSPSIDWEGDGDPQTIPIEERDPDEVLWVEGSDGNDIRRVRLTPEKSPARNIGFDVTPARLVTGLITERGICPASETGLATLFPEKFR